MDSIRTHCLVTFASAEDTAAATAVLQGLVWPPTNNSKLSVQFVTRQDVVRSPA